jgi:quercetin dioxygenase-like cupin family protein
MKIIKQKDKKWEHSLEYYKKVLLTENDLKSKGNLFQIVKIKPGKKIKSHYHKKMKEIFYLLKGNGIIWINNYKLRCKPGDVMLCEPKDKHGAINDTNKELVWLVFKIDVTKNDTFWE